MPRSAARLVTAAVVAAIGIYFSISLAIYADKDDAPGGVVIAMILGLGSLALGAWIALRQPRNTHGSTNG